MLAAGEAFQRIKNKVEQDKPYARASTASVIAHLSVLALFVFCPKCIRSARPRSRSRSISSRPRKSARRAPRRSRARDKPNAGAGFSAASQAEPRPHRQSISRRRSQPAAEAAGTRRSQAASAAAARGHGARRPRPHQGTPRRSRPPPNRPPPRQRRSVRRLHRRRPATSRRNRIFRSNTTSSLGLPTGRAADAGQGRGKSEDGFDEHGQRPPTSHRASLPSSGVT